jgi:hypothetical protein
MQCKGTEKSETVQAFLNFISNVKMSRNKTLFEHGATVQRCNIWKTTKMPQGQPTQNQVYPGMTQ